MGRIGWIVAALAAGAVVLLIFSGAGGSALGIDDDGFARLVYLGLLLAIVGGGTLGSGIRLSGAVGALAFWLGLVLVLVVGYQYRYEFQDVASRLTAGLIPGSPLAMTDEEGRAAVALDKLANGHFGVRAEVNGAPVFFLVDTGATSTVLTAEDARRAGFDPSALSYNVQVMTANGVARAARVAADEISVGAISRERMMMLVAEEGRLGESLLGMNFIASLSGFSVRGERMTLID